MLIIPLLSVLIRSNYP